MTAARAALHRAGTPGPHSRGGHRRRTRATARPTQALALAALTVGTLLAGAVAPAPASAAVFPAERARWERDEAERATTYRVTTPRQGRGAPERAAVRIWQELLNEHGLRAQITGTYDSDTERAVTAFQARRGLPVTGQIDYPTARALLERTIKREASAVGMSPDLLCGHLNLESGLDPAAVGPSGDDLGLGQILMGRWNPGIDVEDALDEDFAIRYMAQRDMNAYRAFGRWPIAVFDYNSPTGAHEWNSTGSPSSRGKNYARQVLQGCDGPEFPGEPGGPAPRTSRQEAAERVSSDLGGWLHELSGSLGSDWDMSGSGRG